eukprot:g12501.t1
MLELTRTVRFCLSGDPGDLGTPRDNTFSSWPTMRGLGRYYELGVTCRGEADAQTGYFINIKAIDQAVRERALPVLIERVADEAGTAVTPMGALMRGLFEAVDRALGGTVAELRLVLTPFLSLAIERDDMATIVMRQQYEFSAAHRLHVPALSDDENREVFGKCNNPAGHGHNYRVEVAVRCKIDEQGNTLEPSVLDAAVDREAIDKLDHRHLNVDVPAFAELNPSVENIVKVVWQMLVDKLPEGSALHEVKNRNKVETAIRITHHQTKIVASATERRHKEQNKQQALFRLRVKLAVQVREPVGPAAPPSERWSARVKDRRLSINPSHDDYPALLAEGLDRLAVMQQDVSAAGEALGISASQLLKLIRHEPEALAQLNDRRKSLELRPLR